MFCNKCGESLPENVKFCPKCGAEVSADITQTENAETNQAPAVAAEPEYISAAGEERKIPKGFSSKKNIIIIIAAAIVLIVGGVTAVAVGTNGFDFSGVRTTLQLADRYLSEQNYEQAIIEFEKVLEIEPMNVDAYLGLAEAYMALGETDKAVEILEEGIEKTGSDRLREKLEEIREGLKTVTTEAEVTVTAPVETTAAVTTVGATTAAVTTVAETTAAVTTIAETIAEITEPIPEATTISESITEPPMEIIIPTNVVMIGGVEYSLDTVTIEGTPLSPDQLVDFDLNALGWEPYCPKELSDLFMKINHPEFVELYLGADVLDVAASIAGSSICRWGYDAATISITKENGYRHSYRETGYSFESFYSLCLDYLTEEKSKQVLESSAIAIYNGELWHLDGGVGSDLSLIHCEYMLLNSTNSSVEIQKTNYHSDDYGSSYDPDKKDQYTTEKYTLKFVLTNKGWRVSETVPWYA